MVFPTLSKTIQLSQNPETTLGLDNKDSKMKDTPDHKVLSVPVVRQRGISPKDTIRVKIKGYSSSPHSNRNYLCTVLSV